MLLLLLLFQLLTVTRHHSRRRHRLYRWLALMVLSSAFLIFLPVFLFDNYEIIIFLFSHHCFYSILPLSFLQYLSVAITLIRFVTVQLVPIENVT